MSSGSSKKWSPRTGFCPKSRLAMAIAPSSSVLAGFFGEALVNCWDSPWRMPVFLDSSRLVRSPLEAFRDWALSLDRSRSLLFCYRCLIDGASRESIAC